MINFFLLFPMMMASAGGRTPDAWEVLRESLEHENATLAAYYALLKITEGNSVLLEEYAREMIVEEELHLDAVNKMLRQPGEIAPFLKALRNIPGKLRRFFRIRAIFQGY